MSPAQPVTFAEFAAVVRARRTSMLVDRERDVPSEIVRSLCELGQWAPNHKRTWPWRFAECTGEGRIRLGQAYADDMIATGFGDEGKREKTRTKYARTPTVLVVGCAPSPSLHLAHDDRDAVAAAIQTMLLGATTLGLASFWSTAPVIVSPAVNKLCSFAEDTVVVGLIYLGWPVSEVEAPIRPEVKVNQVS